MGQNLNNGNVCSGTRRLVTPLPCYPCLQSLESSSQRSHFSDSATFLMSIFIKGKQSFGSHQFLNLRCIRKHVFDSNSIMLLYFCEKSVSLRIETSCFEAKYSEWSTSKLGIFYQCDIFSTTRQSMTKLIFNSITYYHPIGNVLDKQMCPPF